MSLEPDGPLKAIQERVEDQGKRLDGRIDDLKWYITTLSALGSLLVVGLSVYVGINLKSERDSLRDFRADLKQELKEGLGKGVRPAELIILGANGKPLRDQTIRAKVEKDADGDWLLVFSTTERNEGGSSTGPRSFKFYSSDPIVFSDSSSDEPDFKYESYVNPDKVQPREIPGGGYTQNSTWRFTLAAQPTMKGGSYPVLLKAYYGNDRVLSVVFRVSF